MFLEYFNYNIVFIININAEKTPIIPINGKIYFSHLSKVVPAISSVTKIKPVGVIKDIQPCPQLYALITTSLDRPTVSASGAIIGIESTANPEDDGIKNPKKENIIYCATANTPLLIPATNSVE